MSVIPGDVDADRGPSTTIPLRHLLVALCFLVIGVLVGIGNAIDLVPGRAHLAHLHLVLLGWVGVTILGAMTQFVPVWSGVRLHSTRLANLQLALVVLGIVAFVLGWLLLDWAVVAGGALVLLGGVLVFVYNIARTLGTGRDVDVTERHFAYALVAFTLLATLGFLLALDYATGVLATIGVGHGAVRDAHVTLAVFGAVMTTIYGALYQLGTMFTQTELHGVDVWLRRLEEAGHPTGVLLLATGRLLDLPVLERIGGVGVVLGALAVAFVITHKLYEMRVETGPLHVRYAVAMLALAAWALTAAPDWLLSPGQRNGLLGAPPIGGFLVVTAIGFVVLGTLYHVVPFLVWVDRYSDLLGFEPVPMIDDLYDDRIARMDVVLLVAGISTALLSVVGVLPVAAGAVGAIVATAGIGLVVLNLVLVVHRHAPWSLDVVLLGSLSPRPTSNEDTEVR